MFFVVSMSKWVVYELYVACQSDGRTLDTRHEPIVAVGIVDDRVPTLPIQSTLTKLIQVDILNLPI